MKICSSSNLKVMLFVFVCPPIRVPPSIQKKKEKKDFLILNLGFIPCSHLSVKFINKSNERRHRGGATVDKLSFFP